MAIYRRETVVDASFEEVWNFHSRVEGLTAVTPDWMGLTVESMVGPEGNSDPELLVEGTEVRLSTRPFGIGPRQSWTSRVVAREREDGRAFFRDEMVEGPFPLWIHTHKFAAEGDGTRVRDVVEYDLPGGSVGHTASPLAWVGFEPMFRYRHRKTRAILESGDRSTPD